MKNFFRRYLPSRWLTNVSLKDNADPHKRHRASQVALLREVHTASRGTTSVHDMYVRDACAALSKYGTHIVGLEIKVTRAHATVRAALVQQSLLFNGIDVYRDEEVLFLSGSPGEQTYVAETLPPNGPSGKTKKPTVSTRKKVVGDRLKKEDEVRTDSGSRSP